MCEVPGVGAPGTAGGASPPLQRLSVASSGSEEEQKASRHSLLSHSEEKEGPSAELLKGTPTPHDESNEEKPCKPPVVVTVNNMEQKEGEEREGKDEETEKIEIEITIKEKLNEDEKEEESESEAKGVDGGVCDENEKENQENERRHELLENTVRKERDIKGEKTAHGSAEENKRGNDEQASAPDSPKEDEPSRQKEDEEEEEEKGEEEEEEEEKKQKPEQKQDHKEKKEEEEEKGEEEDKETNTKNAEMFKTKEKEDEMKENGQEKKEKKKDRENEKEKEEGEGEDAVDPFIPKCTKEPPITTTHKVSKTVNFLESELKVHSDKKRHTINSFSSSSSSSSSSYKVSKAEGDEEEIFGRLGVDEKAGKHWTLGEGNPVYRLSLKLSPNLFNATDIPGASQHREAEKAGFLTKLSGRSFPYISQWKRRYCVLSRGRLYYYEREDSKAGDKSNGVIQLEYFDQVAEAGPKECKKATNVFIITSQDRSFFDPGRHVFSADTLPDMKDWIQRLQAALDQIRNNNRPAASTSPSESPSAKEGGGKRRRDEAAETKEGKGSQTQAVTTTTTAKERRKKKEESSRPRKSSRVGVSSQTQTSMVEPSASEPDGGRPAMAIPKGGVMLPGFSSRKDPQPTNRTEQRNGDGEAENDLPQAGPTLTCVTKQRVKGPQGRRAPQNHRRKAAAAALKKRASSLSALEHQDAADNRSESSDGATRSYRDSQTPEGDLKEETESEEEVERKKLKKQATEGEEEEEEVQENSPERQFTFDNIDDGLFFKDGLKDMAAMGEGSSKGAAQGKRRSSGLKVNFEEGPSTPSKNGTLGRILRMRESFVTSKRSKFVAKEGLVADHPDMVNNSRWNCVVL